MPRADLVTAELLRGWPLPALDEGGDKNTRGTVHVLGGAVSTPGAVLLAGLGALRVGAGKLQITTVEETAVAVGVAVPEALVNGAPATRGSLLSCPVESGPDAFVVGPGLLEPGELVSCVAKEAGDASVVVDAVALHDLPDDLPGRTVLTPNDKELHSLADGEGPLSSLAQAVADERGAVVVTRGWVAAPDGRLWEVREGSIALGTSGSGDVLAGIVGGLLARGASPEQAGCWGQYLHARAGARVGMLARELLDPLPDLVAELSP